jgi:hypothetical protein
MDRALVERDIQTHRQTESDRQEKKQEERGRGERERS